MYIKLNDFSYWTSAFLKESVLPSFTAHQRKIILIASIALGILAAGWYIISRCSYAAKPLDGPGKITLKDGSKGEGQYKNGKYEGVWKIKGADGSVTEAEYKNGKPHGLWRKTTSDGSQYEIVYENGIKKSGSGKEVSADGAIIEVQTDFDNLLGSVTSPDGSVIEGVFKNGDPHGQWKATNPDGTQKLI